MLGTYKLVNELSAHVEEHMYARYLKEMVPHNYRQLVAFEGDEQVGILGYWLGVKIYCGPYLEIDNLVVAAAHRNKGIGKFLLNEATRIARETGHTTLMLDAFVNNFDAHRFYYREGFAARGFHFIKRLR